MLQCLGAPIRESSCLFGDNESVVKSGSILHSQLSKRHHALAHHYTREAVASKMVSFHHINGDINPADVLGKHWDTHKCTRCCNRFSSTKVMRRTFLMTLSHKDVTQGHAKKSERTLGCTLGVMARQRQLKGSDVLMTSQD